MKLLDLVSPACIVAEMVATERAGAIRELMQAIAAAGLIDNELVDGIVRSIITRERTRGTTGFGKGVAVPHAKVEGVAKPVAAVGRSSAGIDFASLDGQPVHIVFLLVSPVDQPEQHLRAMDLVFRHVQQDKFRRFFVQLSRPEQIHDLLKEADEQMLVG